MDDAVTRTQEWYLDRGDAEDAERVARGTEQPRFNSTNSTGRNITATPLTEPEIEADGQEALTRLTGDLENGVFSTYKVLPPRKVLAERYSVSASAVASAMWELQRQKLLTRAAGNRHIPASKQNTTDISAKDLMLRAIQQHFGIAPFNCSDLRTATGRSNYVIRLYAQQLVSEGRLKVVDPPAGDIDRYRVRHWAVPAPRPGEQRRKVMVSAVSASRAVVPSPSAGPVGVDTQGGVMMGP